MEKSKKRFSFEAGNFDDHIGAFEVDILGIIDGNLQIGLMVHSIFESITKTTGDRSEGHSLAQRDASLVENHIQKFRR